MAPKAPLLPTGVRYDVTIVGTSLPCSLLAASLAMSGCTVLHLDPNQFYSSNWTTLSIDQLTPHFNPAASSSPPPTPDLPTAYGTQPTITRIRPPPSPLFPHGVTALAPHPHPPPLSPHLCSQIHLDLICKPLLASGSLLSLLARTNLGHYLSFRPFDAIYNLFGWPYNLQILPCSRSAVFQSTFLDMREKRLLMRFLQYCLNPYPVPTQGNNRSFDALLSAMSLTLNLKEFLSTCVANAGLLVPAEQAIDNIRTFQQSLSRFQTPTPYLYPDYGTGELAQAFCRLCAVHGGVYVLGRGIDAVVESEDASKKAVVTTEGELVETGKLFIGSELVQERQDEETLWRICGVVDGNLVRDRDVKRGLIHEGVCRIWMLDEGVKVCGDEWRVIHVEGQVGVALEHLKRELGRYVDWGEDEYWYCLSEEEDEVIGGMQAMRKPRLVWGIAYERSIGGGGEFEGGVEVVGSEWGEWEAERVFEEARRCFGMVKPSEEFFRMGEEAGGAENGYHSDDEAKLGEEEGE